MKQQIQRLEKSNNIKVDTLNSELNLFVPAPVAFLSRVGDISLSAVNKPILVSNDV